MNTSVLQFISHTVHFSGIKFYRTLPSAVSLAQTSFDLLLYTCSTDLFNPIALRKDKIVDNFGLSECNRVRCKIKHVCV